LPKLLLINSITKNKLGRNGLKACRFSFTIENVLMNMTDFEKADLCILEYDMDVQPILKDYLMMD